MVYVFKVSECCTSEYFQDIFKKNEKISLQFHEFSLEHALTFRAKIVQIKAENSATNHFDNKNKSCFPE